MPLGFDDKLGSYDMDENGFLRVRARFLAAGTMQYGKHELASFAPPADPEGKIYDIFIGMDTLSDPHALRSLEGMPVVSTVHQWIETDSNEAQVGSIAGVPKVNGPYLEGEIVVTDQTTIDAIKSGELSDISAGYNCAYVMGQGEHDGNFYDGKQNEIRYNHIALLPPGEGRGGREVRVLNTKKELNMPEFTSVQLGDSGQAVRVHNADVAHLNAHLDAARKIKTQNEDGAMKLEETLNKLTENNTAMEALQTENEELKGSLAAVKEQLDAAMDPQAIEETANNIVQERDEAKKLVENSTDEDKEKIENSIKGLSGHELRLFAVNKVRVANGNAAFDGEDAKNESKVQGYFDAYKDMPAKNRKPVVNGAGVAQTQNSGASSSRKTGTAALGYPQKKEA